MFFFDTKLRMSHTSSSSQKEMTHGNWENRLCPTHGLSTQVRFSTMRPTIQRPLQGQTLFLLGPIPLHGLCPTDLSGKPSRYRGMSSFDPTQTLSHGLSRKGLTQYAGSCQRGPRLANLCRLCPDPDWPSTSPLCQRFLRSGIESNRLCFGLHHHRSLSVPFPLGQVPQPQRRCQIAYPFGPARKHPFPRSLSPTARFTTSTSSIS